MNCSLLISVRKFVVPHWRGAIDSYHIFTRYFTLHIQLVLQLQLQSFSLVGLRHIVFHFLNLCNHILCSLCLLYRVFVNVDSKDSQLRTVENAFLLGQLLIYARFSSSHIISIKTIFAIFNVDSLNHCFPFLGACIFWWFHFVM